MGGLKRVKDDDILNIGKTIEKYDNRIQDGDDSTLTSDIDAIREEEKEVEAKKSPGRNSKYSGPLLLHLDEFSPSEYSEDVLQFKEFFDNLGSEGYTYERMFANVDKYNEETGNKDITVSKLKSKLYQMNSLNTISLATVRDISRVLGYEMQFKFQPILTGDIFDNDRKLEDI